MQTLVIYDIPDDRIRNKIGEACKDYGLERIQYSAFLGDMNHNRRRNCASGSSGPWEERRKHSNLPICDKDLKLKTIIMKKKRKLEAR